MLTAVALGEQLFDELEQTLQRVTSYRTNLLSEGDGSVCENANLSVSDPDAGACWSSDCATQLKRKGRFTASSLRT